MHMSVCKDKYKSVCSADLCKNRDEVSVEMYGLIECEQDGFISPKRHLQAFDLIIQEWTFQDLIENLSAL